jgi:hypothetical protein
VAVALGDGSRIEASRTDCRGDPEAALTAEEMVAKARTLMRHGGANDAERLIDGILDLADGGAAVDFTDLFRAA